MGISEKNKAKPGNFNIKVKVNQILATLSLEMLADSMNAIQMMTY